ncbi:hypothetical protein N9Y58_00885 [Alphaproteobacteria bacterium]|nr:hypothetical protein [Alphaproteobacteria bacterium]
MNNFTINDFYLSRDLQENILANINTRRTNAIILAGQKGLGKNNFILKLSKYLLCKFESEDVEINKSFNFDNLIKNKSFFLFDNNSHPDFYYLTKNEEKDNKNIPIEKVRELKSFFYKTFSVSKIKVAIINPIEDLSINSCNLILKTLEELPENSYVFIISNDPVKIPETIKSRCAFFYVNRLKDEHLISFILKQYPDISEQEKFFLMNVSYGSPEIIKEIKNKKIYKFYENLLEDLISSKSFLNLNENNILLINSKDQEFLQNLLNIIINDLIKKSLFYLTEKKYLEFTLEKEKQFIHQIIQNNHYNNLMKLYSEVNKNMSAANLLNLNKPDILIDSFKDLCGI